MFEGARYFNSNVSKWNVEKANNFNCMFAYSGFAGSIAKWNISDGAKLTDMFDNKNLSERRNVGLYHWWVAQDHPEYLSPFQRSHFDRYAPSLMGLGLSPVQTAKILLDAWRNPNRVMSLPEGVLPLPELL